MILPPVIILVEPQMGENIGAAARAMKNFDCTDLRIVNPRDGWPNMKAVAVAAGGKDVIANATIYPSLQDACSDLNFTYATTAAHRSLNKTTISLTDIGRYAPCKQKFGIIFGREKSGLTNNEITFANQIINIPTSPHFNSLNLGQAVLSVCYELFKSYDTQTAQQNSNQNLATIGEMDAMLQQLFETLESKKYFSNEQYQQHSKNNIANFFKKVTTPSKSEINQLRGIINLLSK